MLEAVEGHRCPDDGLTGGPPSVAGESQSSALGSGGQTHKRNGRKSWWHWESYWWHWGCPHDMFTLDISLALCQLGQLNPIGTLETATDASDQAWGATFSRLIREVEPTSYIQLLHKTFNLTGMVISHPLVRLRNINFTRNLGFTKRAKSGQIGTISPCPHQKCQDWNDQNYHFQGQMKNLHQECLNSRCDRCWRHTCKCCTAHPLALKLNFCEGKEGKEGKGREGKGGRNIILYNHNHIDIW